MGGHSAEESEPSEEETDEKFHVELIKKARVNEDAEWEYLVKWWGYDADSDSWEPQRNVQECKRLLQSFWKEIGLDNDDYPIGFEAVPSDEWIEKERRFFKNHFAKDLMKEKHKEQRGSKKVVPGKAVKTKHKTRKPGWAYVTESESDTAEGPSRKAEKTGKPEKSAKKPKAQLKKRTVDDLSWSSESDLPLHKARRVTMTSKEPPLSTMDKGKGKVPVRPRPASPKDDLDSLFSAPSSPDVSLSHRKLDNPPPAESSNQHVAKKQVGETRNVERMVSSTSAAPPAVKPVAISHKDRVPKVKPIDIAMADARRAISTKARIAAGGMTNKPKLTLQDPMDVLNKGPSLKGLSFKKKHPTADTVQSATPTSAGPAADLRKDPLFIPENDIVGSPVSTHGGWGQSPVATSGGGWGQSPVAVSGGGWGQSPVAMSGGGWGAPQSPVDSAVPSGWGEPGPSSEVATSTSVNRRPSIARKPTQPGYVPPLPRRSSVGMARSSPTETTQRNNSHAADQFLASIMPPQLAAPMPEPDGDEIVSEPAPPKALVTKKAPITINSKKWKWNAELYIETDAGSAERICNISLTDATAPKPEGLRLNILYKPETTILRLQKFHQVSDIFLILPACAPVQQYSKLVPQDDLDKDALKTIAMYMTRRRQFTYAHVYLDQDPIGILMVYPSAMTDICSFFKVPSEIRELNGLIAMLIPWTVNISEYQDRRWFPTRRELYLNGGRLDSSLSKKLEDSRRVSNALFSLGLRIHRFTAQVYDFLARHPRDYCIWHSPEDGTYDAPGIETKAFSAVLKACKARDVGYKADVRAIFVHVGALKTFHKLVALGMRRSKRPEVRIYMYGTHETVPPDRWGLREIYPIGGIVTFTPLAIVQNPFGVYDLIERIDKHPLWMCYVHPFVVATVAVITSAGRDPMQLLKNGEFFFERLLQLIEDGKIALLRGPPAGRGAEGAWNHPNPTTEWVGWLSSLPTLDRTELLAECIRTFNQPFGRTSVKDLPSAVEQEVMCDLCQLQYQPVIVDNYRRFVSIIEDRNNPPDTDKDGIELSTLVAFSFKDDYFRG